MSAEHDRLAESDDPRAPWRQWGPYVSARQWGTVREDYSPDGQAWAFFPFDHAHRRTYRWGEDGLGGLCDLKGYLNVGLALWNGHDDRLKERLFGLSGPQGNHGEDVKEYWWALEGTPTHSYATWLYRYPQAAFPYADLVATNAARGVGDDEYELADTGIFDGSRFFDVQVTHAKDSPSDICLEITATNHGPDAAPLHLVPQIWFRNTWSWGLDERRPTLVPDAKATQGYAGVLAEHHELGRVRLTAQDHPLAGTPGCSTATTRPTRRPCGASRPRRAGTRHTPKTRSTTRSCTDRTRRPTRSRPAPRPRSGGPSRRCRRGRV